MLCGSIPYDLDLIDEKAKKIAAALCPSPTLSTSMVTDSNLISLLTFRGPKWTAREPRNTHLHQLKSVCSRPLLQEKSRPEPVPSNGQGHQAHSHQNNNNVRLADHVKWPNESAHRWRPLRGSRIARWHGGAAIRCSAGFGPVIFPATAKEPEGSFPQASVP